MISAQRKSLNKSVDDLMPNTVEEASRRRSKPQDEMQRILAYNAQVGGKRPTPQRQGTGRQVTDRGVQFRKRVVATVFAEAPADLHPGLDAVSDEEAQCNDVVVNRGRRTGIRMRKEVTKDAHGLEDLREFWIAEEESTRLSLSSEDASTEAGGSILSHSSANASSNSFTDSRSVNASAETQIDSSVSDSGTMSASSGRRSSRRSSRTSSISATPASSRASSAGRRSSLRSSAASPLLDSPSDTKLLGDDSPSGGLDASKQRLTFGDPSDTRLSTLSADSISPSASERAKKRHSRVSFADSGGHSRKSSVSFAKTPRFSSVSAASHSPNSVQDDDDMPDVDLEQDAEASQVGSPELGEPSVVETEQVQATKPERKKRKAGEDGRPTLVDRHEKMGRASYSTTDTYAKKAPRLSDIAPRPQVDDVPERRSKRRKFRPLQYWRGEREFYGRSSDAAVPEVVDLKIRSPEATPWRRKPTKSQAEAQAEGASSADSKAKTVRKGARKTSGNNRKGGKASASAKTAAAEAAGDSTEQLDKENAPVNRKATAEVNKSSGGDSAKKQLKKRTPFFVFCTEKRSEVREKHPDMAITDQARVLGRMWGALSEDEKSKYQQLAVA